MRARRALALWMGALLVTAVAAAWPTAAGAAGSPCGAYFDADGNGTDDLAIGTPGEDVLGPTGQVVDAGSVTVVGGDSAGVFGQSTSSAITLQTLGLPLEANARFGAAVATSDLNGDTCADLAIGVPGLSAGAGAVVVVWGSAGGLDLADPQFLRQGAAPVGSTSEAGDGFGSTLAVAGSLPTGGVAALWVGSPGEDWTGSLKDVGMLTQLRTSAGGLVGSGGVTHMTQNTAGVPGDMEPGDRFGERLAGGGRTLLVGVPHEDVGTLKDAGVYYALTLASGTWKSYAQGVGGVPGVAEAYDVFGSAVTLVPGCAGPTDESYAVGASGEDSGTLVNAGIVTLRDAASGRGRAFVQGGAGLPGKVEAGDAFGATLVTAGELVIGAPGEDVGTAVDAGDVTVVALDCDASGGLVPGPGHTWSQGASGAPGAAETNDRFGRALGSSLVTVSGQPSLQPRLVVGAPGESEGAVRGSGNVTVFAAVNGALSSVGAKAFGQASGTIADEPETDDGFGGSLDASNATVL